MEYDRRLKLMNAPLRWLGENTRILRGRCRQQLAWLVIPAVIMLLAACFSQETVRDHKVTPLPTSPQVSAAAEQVQEKAQEPTSTGAKADTPTFETATKPAGGSAELVAQGQALFAGAGGCGACHTVNGVTAGLVGPDLSHLGTDAASRNPGMTARDYIEESIRAPEAFVASGVERAIPGIMTQAITSGLSDDQVNALVEFLLAQK